MRTAADDVSVNAPAKDVFERHTSSLSCDLACRVCGFLQILKTLSFSSSLYHNLWAKKARIYLTPHPYTVLNLKSVLNFSKANEMPPLRAPEPSRTFFDPFNPSSTGHQRAENRLSGSTSWRDSRSQKLAQQLRDTSGGGDENHLADSVGAGSENFEKDGRKENGSWEVGAPGLRDKGWQDIRSLVGVSRKRKCEDMAKNHSQPYKKTRDGVKDGNEFPEPHIPSNSFAQRPMEMPAPVQYPESNALMNSAPESIPSPPQIFRSLTLYLNGSTHSSGISDHSLKSLFVQHGGSVSIALGRRTVTHVVLGSEGGGLAASKIQSEVTKVAGKTIRFVTARWVVDSVDCGKRQPESKYQAVHTAMKGQKSVVWKSGNVPRGTQRT